MTMKAIVAIVAMQMTIPAIQMTPRQISSSDIPSLEKKANDLDQKVEYWTRFSNGFVAGTAIATLLAACAAVGYFVGQKQLVLRAKQAATAHSELSKAKEDALRGHIATVEEKGKTESSRIEAEGKKEAARIEGEANIKISAANERAGEANREAGKARAEAATALLEQERLRQENIVLGRRLEAERSRRVQLQRSVLHRMIPQIGVGNKMNWDSLKPFKGVNVSFKYPNGEPAMFSGSVGAILQNAGWNFLGGQMISPNGIEEGVTILAYKGPKGETDRSMEAAKALFEFMASSGIEEVRFSGAAKGVPEPDTIEVIFGPMPDPFKNLE